MRRPLIALLSRASLLTLFALPAHEALADRANGTAVQGLNEDMLRIAEAFLATVAQPAGIETAVGYDRKELVALQHEDPARTNYVYWPYLRKGLPLDYMSAEQRVLVHDLLNTALSATSSLRL